MQKVSDAGFKDQINWVKSSLQQALEDRADSISSSLLFSLF